MALLWMLNLSDGSSSVLDIAERSGLPFDELRRATESLWIAVFLENSQHSFGDPGTV